MTTKKGDVKYVKKLVSLLLVAVLLPISSFSLAFAVPTSNMLPKISSIDAEQKSAIEYDRFLKDVNNFKKFIQAQKPKQGSLSDDAFLLKCAIEYHNQKVSNGELEGPLLDLNETMDLKTSSSQVTIQSAGITKSLVRAQLWTAAELASIVVPEASFFLQHSLQDNPSDEYLPSSDSIVPEIKGTQAYKNAIAPFKSSSSTSQISYPVFTASNSNWDLYLALHNTTMYSYSSGKSITSYVTDTYDFQPKNWGGYGSGIPNAAVTLINNYGVYAQSVGAVVPYYISITVPDTK